MPSDKFGDGQELTFAGCPARVLLELELGRNGATTLIPIGDLAQVHSGGSYSSLTVYVKGPLLRRVLDVVDDVECKGLDQ